jgi:cytochrome c oxidase cbb3-type subunit 4
MPEMGPIRGLITVLTLISFLGICWWAYRPGNRARFEADGWMAFDDAEVPEEMRGGDRVGAEESS